MFILLFSLLFIATKTNWFREAYRIYEYPAYVYYAIYKEIAYLIQTLISCIS